MSQNKMTTSSPIQVPLVAWARLSYPHLWEPRAVTQNGRETGEPRFGAQLHLDNTPPETIRIIQMAIRAAYEARWPDPNRRPAFYGQVDGDPKYWTNGPGLMRTPLVWGPADPSASKDSNATGWVLSASAKADNPPGIYRLVLGADGRTFAGHSPETDRAAVYPGCEACCAVSIYAYEMSSTSLGVSAGLNMVFLTHRDLGRFDSRPSPQAALSQLSGMAPPPVAGSPAQPQPGFGQAPQPGFGQAPQPGFGQAPQPGFGFGMPDPNSRPF